MAVTRNAWRSSAAQSSRRRNPGRTSGPPSSHRPTSSNDPTDSEQDHDSQVTASPQAATTGTRPTPNISDADSSPPPSPPASTSKHSRSLRTRAAGEKPKSKGARHMLRPSSGKASRHESISPTKRRKLSSLQCQEAPTGVTPDWRDPRIPFACWADIFLYAASLGTADGLATSWLVHAATTCRNFAEPALTALYRCPLIKQASKAKRLAALLERPPSETLFKYRVKIEVLHINIHIVPQAILPQLIHPLSRLQELTIYTPADQPPYRQLDRNLRWHYTEDIFRALAADRDGPGEKWFPTMLKSWEWSGRFIGGCVPSVQAMGDVHQTPPFSQLTKLSLTNFQVPSLRNLQQKSESEEEELRADHEDGLMIESVAHAISQLARLKHLVFESSTVLNHRLLPLLPKQLAHLELINCWEVKSEDLAEFLRTHGGNLRTLTLLHNQSLDLGFLTTLSETCPSLRELHMNLSYYRHHDCVNDADPMYDQALLPSQVPTWPPSLRVIDIEHVRDWSAEAAETCLQSLIDNAGNLPHLRHLAIKSTLDIPWQARATMRREWRARMEKVFLRPLACPESHATMRPLPAETEEPPRKRKRSSGPPSPPSRRSGRLAAQADGHTAEVAKSLRRQRRQLSYRDPDTDEDEAELSQETDDAAPDDTAADGARSSGGHGDLVVQGFCKTVNLQFDNQKVRELQYGMEDFLDDGDTESEDEWQEDDDDDESIVIFR
ncbi:hypothetical protein HRG_000946 [Hirsutella rhossiliensis]|uniref:Uncharacterized protein n=1 Tax=Hirsutella rhossiliensis TaxID=111463 RepID=A0A9P8N7R3_9HYPO|nr:uncharacterized protein HRG_00946 [Hirsutella rhossiliensis]KAH0968304.1 hypothetical protein HRG_00946 [Hirsutella rhossiliensis]